MPQRPSPGVILSYYSTEGKWAPQRQCLDVQHLLEEQFLSPAAFIGHWQQLCAEEKESCYHPAAVITFFSHPAPNPKLFPWHQALTGFCSKVQFSWLFCTKHTEHMADDYLTEITNQTRFPYHLPSAQSHSKWWWNKKAAILPSFATLLFWFHHTKT